ncbi:hypothetical protein [Sporolituus thermophilus]|uniref:Uncharacterized protein n=1 Tax=Sporolituus thermophilus DSM 23256 TaxID=1123285 RepID=A0A1G7K3F1_9FIRM|nr:hypothetical protein [Sporolituus thermophilus]SDF31763.1 hypothetical protein SAMN05660235_01159 [Sporolituus thermophilus DSM 23256]
MREKIDEIIAEFTLTSLYADAENRYVAALAHVDKNIADEIEHAHADMAVELMAAAYARGAADARKILRAGIMYAANDLPESDLPAIVEAFLSQPLAIESFPLEINEELGAIAIPISHERGFEK